MTDISRDEYLGSAALKKRFGGASDQTIWRWLKDDKLKFPKPIYINGRRFWKLGDLANWERERAAVSCGKAA